MISSDILMMYIVAPFIGLSIYIIIRLFSLWKW